MSADQHRVRLIVHGGRSYLTEPFDDREAAVAYMRTAAEQVRAHAGGTRLLAFPTVEAPTAFIPARDVRGIELATLPAPGPPARPGGRPNGATP